MAEGDSVLTEALAFTKDHLGSVLSAVVVLGTLVPFGVFLFDFLGLRNVWQRATAALLLLLGFVFLGGSLLSYYLYDSVAELREDSRLVTLTCLAFEVLSGEDGRARDDTHVYDRHERVYDLTGDQQYLKNTFVGQVAIGRGPSDGIPLKFIGDYGLDVENLPGRVVRHRPLDEGQDPVELEPEVIDKPGAFEVILHLPFGRELEAGEEFELTFECDGFGRSPPPHAPENRVHFPMHRYRRIDQFLVTIRLPNGVTDYQTARVATVPDLSQDRVVPVEDLELVQDYDLDRVDRGDHVEFSMNVTREANSLFLFRFLREWTDA